MRKILLLCIVVLVQFVSAQSNIKVTNTDANAVLFGNYDPGNYLPQRIINHHDSILEGIVNDVSSDTMISWLEHIDGYHNRNTGSDTLSETKGIGAVRRWIYSKLSQFSALNENRLLVSYLDFDNNICGMPHHRNVFGVLPGIDTTNKEIVFIEGHFDTRCEGVCDTACYSPGMDDNGSGTVLVMELARVMSKYAFYQTVVFALTTGEDQGLYGATAFAEYFKDNNLVIRACLNNDVVGGIECGNTSSPPSCPYYTHLDSLNVRVFSYSFGNDSSRTSNHKQLARYLKMHQEEDINPLLVTPLNINIMIREDRVGRGGDHIPFRQRFYPSIRVCSQNEHGDGTGTPPDRQHSTRDILGLDTSVPPDAIIDSFFVDPGYLKRNTIMNGVNLGFLAMGPPQPFPEVVPLPDGVSVQMIGQDTVYKDYRLAVRSKGSGTLYFDTVYSFTGTTSFQLEGLNPDTEYYFSVMSVLNDIESLPSWEHTVLTVGTGDNQINDGNLRLYQNVPNPFYNQTQIKLAVTKDDIGKNAAIEVRDIAGRLIQLFPLKLSQGEQIIKFENNDGLNGLYTFSLFVDGRLIQTRKMVMIK